MANITKENLAVLFVESTEIRCARLIAGPNGAYICDECVEICCRNY